MTGGLVELLILLLVIVLLIGLVYWGVDRSPLSGNAKNFLYMVVVIVVILFVLGRYAGLNLGGL